VRVIDRQNQTQDEHFTEGEPDLEAPEELAVLELDDETELEEDLDSRADLEDDVDLEVLESSLEHLVHGADDDGADDDGADDEGLAGEDLEIEDLEIEDLEDRVESLDRILAEKLAGDEEPAVVDDDGDDPVGSGRLPPGPVTASSWGADAFADEFVCRSCLLVRRGSQRGPTSGSVCQDCEE
jgi:hypothetical protein